MRWKVKMDINNNIESIFKKAFSDCKENADKDLWYEIDSRVSRNNFMKFSISNFNIFYLITIIITFLLTSLLTVDYMINPKNETKIKQQPQNIQYIYDTITETRVIHKIIKEDNHKIKQENSESEYNISTEKIDEKIPVDSITNSILNENNETRIADTVKTVIIIKPPAIVKKDTVMMKVAGKKKNSK